MEKEIGKMTINDLLEELDGAGLVITDDELIELISENGLCLI